VPAPGTAFLFEVKVILKDIFCWALLFLVGFCINYNFKFDVQTKFSNSIKGFKIIIMKIGKKALLLTDVPCFIFQFTGIYKHLE